MSKPTVRSLRHTNFPYVINWCRDYHFNNPWPADFSKRFAIGLYQIHGGFEWGKSQPNVAESFCAAALHFLMVIEALQLDWANDLPSSVLSIESRNHDKDFKTVLLTLSRAQQQILYASQLKGLAGTVRTGRSTRYKPWILGKDLCDLVCLMFSWVRRDDRLQGIIDATEIMTKRI